MYNDQIISYDEHMSWYQSLQKSEVTHVKILLYFEEPIGLVNFNKINKHNNTCYWGFYIGNLNAPKGSGTILGYLALSYIFENQKVRKVCSEIIGNNIQSIKFHQKIGFVEEGRLIEHINKDNKFVDVILMAQFHYQWNNFKNELEKKLGGEPKL